MAEDRMALLEVLRKASADGDTDFLREGVRVLAQAVMEAEVSELTGLPKGGTPDAAPRSSAMSETTAPWFPKRKHGHVVVDVQFGESRFLECSCGHLIVDAESDEAQGAEFGRHRRESPSESKDRIRTRLAIAR
jgi:hypothetical protein